jgi:hypothetical protein
MVRKYQRDVIKKTHSRTTSTYSNIDIAKITARYIAICSVCQRHSPQIPSVNPKHALRVHDIFTHWSVNFAGPFPPDMMGTNTLVSEFVTSPDGRDSPYENKQRIRCRQFPLLRSCMPLWFTQSLQTDNCPHYANEVVERLCDALKIRHHFSTSYYPRRTIV